MGNPAMSIPRCVIVRLIPLVLLVAVPLASAQPAPKKKVVREADLPRHSYPVEGLASALVQAEPAAFGTFASRVRADLEAELRDYDIEDRSTLRDLLSAKFALQEIAGDYPAALETLAALRSLEDKPSPKLTTGLLGRAWLRAAIDTKSTAGPAFEAVFEREYGAAVAALPWDVVQDWTLRS